MSCEMRMVQQTEVPKRKGRRQYLVSNWLEEMHTEPYKKKECIFQAIVTLLRICPNVHLVIVRIYIHKCLSHLSKTLQRYFFLISIFPPWYELKAIYKIQLLQEATITITQNINPSHASQMNTTTCRIQEMHIFSVEKVSFILFRMRR